jgi:hypothetical protein
MGRIVARISVKASAERGAAMTMNPDLIKHDIDGEEYANACPTVGTLMVAHFSTPERHRSDIYGADGLFFTAHPDRRMYMRPAFRGEYDLDERETQNVERPMLWVLVSQFTPGFHMVLPVWRGRNFWSGMDCNTDQGVGSVLLTMCLRGGLNLSEWMAYIYDQRARKTDTAATKATKQRVH